MTDQETIEKLIEYCKKRIAEVGLKEAGHYQKLIEILEKENA